jgi:putative transposase
MAKLDERKIRWIIHEKLRGRGGGGLSNGTIAMIQHVSPRRIKQLWQEYRRTRQLPTLGKPGRPRNHLPINEETIILEAFDRYQAGAVALESILRARYGVRIPHNRIHKVLRVNGRAMTQPAKQLRRRWVRYERTHSMSLWHTDWKQLPDNRWIIAYMDDASRLIVGYGVFQDATAEHTIQVLKQAIAKHGRPDEMLTDRGSQFYANESERREKGISQFERFLADNGIKHILCRVNHPQRA